MLEDARRSRESEVEALQSELTQYQLQAAELPLLKREIQRLRDELAAASESAASHAELRSLSDQLVKLQDKIHGLEREKRQLIDDLLSARSRLKAVDALEAQVRALNPPLTAVDCKGFVETPRRRFPRTNIGWPTVKRS
jgi:DNA repair exonuclease SbcCD ATPase subunit